MVNSDALVSLDDIRNGGGCDRAPCSQDSGGTSSAYLGDLMWGARLNLKLEMFQKTGSFKPRGVLNKMANLTR